MKSDIEIARGVSLRKIKEIATRLGIPREEVQNYGKYIAKIPLHLIDEQKIKEQAHLQQERQFSAYRARSNQEVLQYKVELIERLIEEVKNEFMTMDDELFKTYFQRHCYAQRHIKVVKTTTKRQAVIAEIIEENKFEIDLQIDESIVDGFILVADHIDYNYEFDKLFAYYHEQLVEFTRKGLFNE